MPEGNLPFRTVFLVGFMGSGKTSVGRALSELLHCPFEDLDHRIESGERRSIAEIFHDYGENRFREVEHLSLNQLVEQRSGSRDTVVVALGGGAFAQPRNAALLQAKGWPVIFLDAPPVELLRRCRQQDVDRPLAQDERRFHELYEERKPHYMKAQMRIDTQGREVQAIAKEIAAKLTAQAKSTKEK
jgi:shikimate kinase